MVIFALGFQHWWNVLLFNFCTCVQIKDTFFSFFFPEHFFCRNKGVIVVQVTITRAVATRNNAIS